MVLSPGSRRASASIVKGAADPVDTTKLLLPDWFLPLLLGCEHACFMRKDVQTGSWKVAFILQCQPSVQKWMAAWLLVLIVVHFSM